MSEAASLIPPGLGAIYCQHRCLDSLLELLGINCNPNASLQQKALRISGAIRLMRKDRELYLEERRTLMLELSSFYTALARRPGRRGRLNAWLTWSEELDRALPTPKYQIGHVWPKSE